MQLDAFSTSRDRIAQSGLPFESGDCDPRLHITVGIASIGRPDVLQRTICRLRRQTRSWDRLLLSLTCERDLDDAVVDDDSCNVLFGRPGLTRQRNAILNAARDSDVVIFFDDDFVPADDYLAQVETLFLKRPNVVMATGRVLADGIIGPGIDFDTALHEISHAGTGSLVRVHEIYNGYGCNMALRMLPIRQRNIEFDPDLPLYGWLEDVDFSRQLAPFGQIVLCPTMRGVHLGTKSGRQAGVKLGYSQIANPIHLVRKRTMQTSKALWLMMRNIGMNALYASRPEPFVDRAGRLRGNLHALRDLLLWRLHPRRILDMQVGEGTKP